MMPKPNCLTCGLCCMSLQDQDVYCDVEDGDLDTLPSSFIAKYVKFDSPYVRLAVAVSRGDTTTIGAIKTKWRVQTRGVLKGTGCCQCVALRGNVLDSVWCGIYAVRPRTCHVAMTPGEPACMRLRKMVRSALSGRGRQCAGDSDVLGRTWGKRKFTEDRDEA